MAVKFCCDGCGTLIDRANHRGMVVPKQYCDSCVIEIDFFLVELDELHSSVAKLFTDGLAEKRAAYKKKHPTGALPDETA